jgi:hypothetical protein
MVWVMDGNGIGESGCRYESSEEGEVQLSELLLLWVMDGLWERE